MLESRDSLALGEAEGAASGLGPAALVTARWALGTVAAGLVLTQYLWPGLFGGRLVSGWLAPTAVIALWMLGNAYASSRRSGAVGEAGVHLVLDVGLLTVLLALMGGANNPFTMLYFLPITLATLLSRGWTWAVALSAVVGFAVLVFVFTAAMHGHHQHGGHFGQHLVGMGVALAVTGALTTYFVHQIAAALLAQRAELERLRQEAREDRYVASLGALAAGAAHELGTPLGTIQLLVGELAVMGADERAESIEGIERELVRCKAILHGLSSPELSAEALERAEPWTLHALGEVLRLQELPQGVPLSVEVHEVESASCGIPRTAVEQLVRELCANAAHATVAAQGGGEVRVVLRGTPDSVHITVADRGCGMDARELAEAFQPFRSYRPGGRGLGLFLARAHVRQLGGAIALDSELERGTTAQVELPRVVELRAHRPAPGQARGRRG